MTSMAADHLDLDRIAAPVARVTAQAVVGSPNRIESQALSASEAVDGRPGGVTMPHPTSEILPCHPGWDPRRIEC
jgi:hypothetical protein